MRTRRRFQLLWTAVCAASISSVAHAQDVPAAIETLALENGLYYKLIFYPAKRGAETVFVRLDEQPTPVDFDPNIPGVNDLPSKYPFNDLGKRLREAILEALDNDADIGAQQIGLNLKSTTLEHVKAVLVTLTKSSVYEYYANDKIILKNPSLAAEPALQFDCLGAAERVLKQFQLQPVSNPVPSPLLIFQFDLQGTLAKTLQANQVSVLLKTPSYPLERLLVRSRKADDASAQGCDVIWLPFNSTNWNLDALQYAVSQNPDGALREDERTQAEYEMIRSSALFPQDETDTARVRDPQMQGFTGFRKDSDNRIWLGTIVDFRLMQPPSVVWPPQNRFSNILLATQGQAPRQATMLKAIKIGFPDLATNNPPQLKRPGCDRIDSGKFQLVNKIWTPSELVFKLPDELELEFVMIRQDQGVFYLMNGELTARQLLALLRANVSPVMVAGELEDFVKKAIKPEFATAATAEDQRKLEIWQRIITSADEVQNSFATAGAVNNAEKLLSTWLFVGLLGSSSKDVPSAITDKYYFADFQLDELDDYFLMRACAWAEVQLNKTVPETTNLPEAERWTKFDSYCRTKMPARFKDDASRARILARYRAARTRVPVPFPSHRANPLDWPISRVSPKTVNALLVELTKGFFADNATAFRLPQTGEWLAAAESAWQSRSRPTLPGQVLKPSEFTWTGNRGFPWSSDMLREAHIADRPDQQEIRDLVGNVSELVMEGSSEYRIIGGNYRSDLDQTPSLLGWRKSVPVGGNVATPFLGLRFVYRPSAGTTAPIAAANETTDDLTDGLYKDIFGTELVGPPGTLVERWKLEQDAVSRYFGTHRTWRSEYLRRVVWGTSGDACLRDQLPWKSFKANLRTVLDTDVNAGCGP
jgi:hypothetical protein